MGKSLLYRIVPEGGVVFATPERAAFVACIQDALEKSETWGAFRAAMPPEEMAAIDASFDEADEPRPSDDDAFSPLAIVGYGDGDYPPWLMQEMETVIPRTLLAQFGEERTTTLNGNYWHIPRSNLDAICAALEADGWRLAHEPDFNFY